MARKEFEIDSYPNEQVVAELKSKGLPTFGTPAERKERLKKSHGISCASASGNGTPSAAAEVQMLAPKPSAGKKSGVLERIEELKQKRDERRKKMEDDKKHKQDRLEENQAAGKMGDVDFELMIEKHRLKPGNMFAHISPENLKIIICVRKRPIFKKEQTSGEMECVSVANPRIVVHQCNVRVDGITKYVEDHNFQFDNVIARLGARVDIC